MSTENLREEAEAARAALGQVAKKAEQRKRQLERDRRGLQKERDTVVVGARAVMQNIDDKDGVLEEEEQQLDHILQGPPAPVPEPELPAASEPKEPEAPATVTPEPMPGSSVFDQDAEPSDKADKDFVPSPPYTSAQLRGMSNDRLHVVAKYFDMDMPVTDHNRDNVIVYILSVQAGMRRGVERTTTVRERVVDIIDVRRWTGMQWVLAILGIIIGLVVANVTYDMYDDINGFGRGLLVTLWFVFVAGFGFFLGGYIGSYVDRDDEEGYEET